jgi:hypothetical protein
MTTSLTTIPLTDVLTYVHESPKLFKLPIKVYHSLQYHPIFSFFFIDLILFLALGEGSGVLSFTFFYQSTIHSYLSISNLKPYNMLNSYITRCTVISRKNDATLLKKLNSNGFRGITYI